MKKVILKTVEFLTGTKIHATHSEIKGKKSNGSRDSSGAGVGSDFKNEKGYQ
jgi:hypothetical protein